MTSNFDTKSVLEGWGEVSGQTRNELGGAIESLLPYADESRQVSVEYADEALGLELSLDALSFSGENQYTMKVADRRAGLLEMLLPETINRTTISSRQESFGHLRALVGQAYNKEAVRESLDERWLLYAIATALEGNRDSLETMSGILLDGQTNLLAAWKRSFSFRHDSVDGTGIQLSYHTGNDVYYKKNRSADNPDRSVMIIRIPDVRSSTIFEYSSIPMGKGIAPDTERFFIIQRQHGPLERDLGRLQLKPEERSTYADLKPTFTQGAATLLIEALHKVAEQLKEEHDLPTRDVQG